jgi:hypothetical protein
MGCGNGFYDRSAPGDLQDCHSGAFSNHELIVYELLV